MLQPLLLSLAALLSAHPLEVGCLSPAASGSNSSAAPASVSPIALAWRSQQQQQRQQQPVQSRLPLPLAQYSQAQQQQQLANPLNNETLMKQVHLVTIKHNQLMRNLTQQQQQQQLQQMAPALAQAHPGRAHADQTKLTSQDLQDEYQAHINSAGHEITKILRRFFQDGYDRRVRPNYSGPPALVNVSFHIISISSVSEVQMDFTADFYFRQKWFDPRLEFKPVGQIEELCVGAEFAEKIWLPDTFFANEKTATFHKATTENTFIRVGYNGRVYRSIRLTVTCSCPMDLQYFPMDQQRCKIEIESYGYSTSEIDYRWEKGNESVTLDGKIELPQFKVLGFRMGQELQSLSSGDYIRLYCEVTFVRSMGYYLIQIYIPASLIVIISWVSFWLHRNATPARVTLGVTTVLTMTTLMSSTNAALPKISYIKSIDVFLGTCFVMVFASLLEYATVGYIGKRIAMKRKYQQDLQQMQQHHQKVCVAAAASAAAAAAAVRHANPVGVAAGLLHNKQLKVAPSGNANSTNNNSAKQLLVHMQHDQTRTRPTTGKPLVLQQMRHCALESDTVKNSPPPAAMTIAAQQQQSAQPSAEATAGQESVASKTQTGDQPEPNVRICGLTPSDIDKYSRVVFPICFFCFCQMYWIIYGHISQQVDDHGPPLIPFVRS